MCGHHAMQGLVEVVDGVFGVAQRREGFTEGLVSSMHHRGQRTPHCGGRDYGIDLEILSKEQS